MGTITADEAYEQLKLGHQRFRADTPQASGRDASRRKMLAASQNPFAAVLCCADSRVVPEIAFDTGLGELFVIRVAGNVANRATIASIEFAVAVLGIKLVVVMGHGNCGAVAAAIENEAASPHLRYLLDHIRPSVENAATDDLDAIARVNAVASVERIVSESALVRGAIDGGDVRIVAAFYTPGTGEIDVV